LFTGVGCLWALASPLFSSPDEPAHVVRAVAASRGQILPGERTEREYSTYVEVPEVFALSGQVPMCFAFQGDIGADCGPAFEGGTKTTKVETNAGLYPPAYYAVVGLPSVVFPSAKGVYLMRALNAALCGAFLASAIASARHTRSPRLVIGGIAIAATPMLFFLGGSVNPSGVEIAASICLWTSLYAALERSDTKPSGRLLLRIAVAGSALALSRPGSPMWVALIAVVLVAWFGLRRVFEVGRDRRTWPVVAAVGLASLSTLLWVSHYGTLTTTNGGLAGSDSLAANTRIALGTTGGQIDQMIGVFGWLDTGPATLTIYLWLFALGTLVLLGLAAASWYQRLVLLGVTAAVVLLPVILQVPRAETQGFPWQGRYTLPLAVGLPILATLLIDKERGLPDRFLRQLVGAVLAMWVVGQLYAYIWATRRYTAGVHGPLNWLTADGFHPPVPVWSLFAGTVVVLTVGGVWLYGLATDGPTPWSDRLRRSPIHR
jgi:hypothetical protein